MTAVVHADKATTTERLAVLGVLLPDDPDVLYSGVTCWRCRRDTEPAYLVGTDVRSSTEMYEGRSCRERRLRMEAVGP